MKKVLLILASLLMVGAAVAQPVISGGTPVVNGVSTGGTGLTTLATGRIPYGNGTLALASDANLAWLNSLLTAPISDKGGQVFNVKAYGAVGNGSHDDTAAINSAIAAIPSTGGTVFFPAGVYLISSGLSSGSVTTTFEGAGGVIDTGSRRASTTILKAAAMNATAISLVSNGSGVVGLQIDGQAGNSGDGILINTNRAWCRDVTVSNMGRYGIFIGGSNSTNSNSWILDHVLVSTNVSHGLFVDSSSYDAGAGLSMNVVANSNGGDGFRFDREQADLLLHCVSEGNTGAGVHFVNAQRSSVVGGDYEANATNQNISIESTASDILIQPNTVTGTITNSSTTTMALIPGTPITVPNGGTGLATLTAGYIPVGNGTSAFGSSSSLIWDGTHLGLAVGALSASGHSRIEISDSGKAPSLTSAASGTFQFGTSGGIIVGAVDDTSPWGVWLQTKNLNADGITYPIVLNPLGGNVGIGTRSPAAKLAVNGGVHVGGDSDPGDNNLLVDGYSAIAVGGNVASGTTITPTGAIFHVTGVTAIATINLPFTGFTGSITIIPDGIFATTTAGNIALISTAVVSKVLIMTYDGTKWYPSY